jgi:hypothetical protein
VFLTCKLTSGYWAYEKTGSILAEKEIVAWICIFVYFQSTQTIPIHWVAIDAYFWIYEWEHRADPTISAEVKADG